MKTQILLIFFLFSLSVLNIQLFGQTVKIMSFNIRYDNQLDGKDKWDNRKAELTSMINYYNPGIIGIQEGLNRQVKYINDQMPNYSYIGIGRKDGKERGEYSAIFYDTTKFSVLNSGTFWLSDKSEKVSVGWDAVLERICTYGLFETKDHKKKFWVFNTHFDHKGEKAKEMSAKLILKKIKALNKQKLPLILTGDFNSLPESKAITILSSKLNIGSGISDKKIYGPEGTFNSFNNSKIIKKRIDYIFVSRFNVLDYRHIDDKLKNNNCISDHFPVLASLKFNKEINE